MDVVLLRPLRPKLREVVNCIQLRPEPGTTDARPARGVILTPNRPGRRARIAPQQLPGALREIHLVVWSRHRDERRE